MPTPAPGIPSHHDVRVAPGVLQISPGNPAAHGPPWARRADCVTERLAPGGRDTHSQGPELALLTILTKTVCPTAPFPGSHKESPVCWGPAALPPNFPKETHQLLLVQCYRPSLGHTGPVGWAEQGWAATDGLGRGGWTGPGGAGPAWAGLAVALGRSRTPEGMGSYTRGQEDSRVPLPPLCDPGSHPPSLCLRLCPTYPWRERPREVMWAPVWEGLLGVSCVIPEQTCRREGRAAGGVR